LVIEFSLKYANNFYKETLLITSQHNSVDVGDIIPLGTLKLIYQIKQSYRQPLFFKPVILIDPCQKYLHLPCRRLPGIIARKTFSVSPSFQRRYIACMYVYVRACVRAKRQPRDE